MSKCRLRSLRLQCALESSLHKNVGRIVKEALTLTESSNFPMCMHV